MVVVIVNLDACAGLTTIAPSPVASNATPALTMCATSVKCASLTLASSGLLRISEAVGVLAAWFVVAVQPVSISTAMPSVALGFAFTWPILVDGYVEPAPGLDQVRFLEDHGPGRQR